MGFIEKFRQQEEEKRLKFQKEFPIPEKLGIRQILTEVNTAFWDGMGQISESTTDHIKFRGRSISLEFKYDSAMFEYETREVTQRDVYSEDQGSQLLYSEKYASNQKTQVLKSVKRDKATSSLGIHIGTSGANYDPIREYLNGRPLIIIEDSDVAIVHEGYGDYISTNFPAFAEITTSSGSFNVNYHSPDGKRALGILPSHDPSEQDAQVCRSFLEMLVWRSCTQRKNQDLLPQSLALKGQKAIEDYKHHLKT